MHPAQFPRVSLGEDGILYLIGGSNDTLNLYQPELFQTVVPLEQWDSLLSQRQEALEELNIPWQFILAPEKLSIYGREELSKWIPGPIEAPGHSFSKLMKSPSVLYPQKYLIEQSQQYKVYPTSDSHWSSIGAFCVFQLLCSSLKLNMDFSKYFSMPEVILNYHGDLWSEEHSHLPPEAFTRRKVSSSIREIYKNQVVGLKEKNKLENEVGLHVGSHIVWYNKDPEVHKKIILFGTSFSDCRLECSLFSYIVSLFFEETHFIWSTSLDLGYITRHRPDYLFVEMPERFLTQCPKDNISIEELGLAVIKKWKEK